MNRSQTWNSEQLIAHSLQRAGGYCPGTLAGHQPHREPSPGWTSRWSQRFGEYLTQGYGPGL